ASRSARASPRSWHPPWWCVMPRILRGVTRIQRVDHGAWGETCFAASWGGMLRAGWGMKPWLLEPLRDEAVVRMDVRGLVCAAVEHLETVGDERGDDEDLPSDADHLIVADREQRAAATD